MENEIEIEDGVIGVRGVIVGMVGVEDVDRCEGGVLRG